MTGRLVCLGLGYTARALVRRLDPARWRVTGTARSAEACAALRNDGHEAILFDGTAPVAALAAEIASATHVLHSIAPGDDGDPGLRWHAADIASAPSLRWIGYLSTVGVYGDTGGAWVDETAEPRPGSPRTKRRVAAERAWLDLAQETAKTVQVFRLAGIYGPGRSAIDDLREGTARRIVKPGQVFNRIHVDDIAAVLASAMAGAGRERIYNVADNHPAPPQEVVAFAAELLGRPAPPEIPFELAELSPMARSFYGENRRVRADRIVADLGVRLAYPSYREGLTAIAG